MNTLTRRLYAARAQQGQGAARPAPALAAAAVVAVAAAFAARRLAKPQAPVVADAVVVPGGFPIPFEALAEAMPDPLLVVAGGGDRAQDGGAARIVFANAAARDLLRLTEDNPLLVQAIRRPDALEAIEESLAGGPDRTVPFEAGGVQERIWRLSSTRLPGISGAGRIALVVLHDETDARRNERMRADFLANASHELRTPLASLTGFIETLRGAARDDEKARDRFLGIMAAQADRMGRLINDLLSLSRIELNEHIRPSGSCDLAMAVNDVVDAMGTIADAAKTRLDIRLSARGDAVILGDRDQILQVVQNLLDNALKYSPPDGKATVEVAHGLSVEQATAGDPASPRLGDPAGGRLPLVTPDRSDGQLYAVVRVTDQGPGMAREHLPRLA